MSAPGPSAPRAARVEHLVASAADAGDRLDRVLAARLPDLSRTQIQRLIRDGHVRVSRGHVKPGLAVDAGLEVDVTVPAPAPLNVTAEPLPLTILYEDADIVVIDKPAGLVVHPSAGHRSGTIVNALLHHLAQLSGEGGADRPGIVHRLDRGTSGVMVVARHDRAHRELARQFRDRLVRKQYRALVWGTVRAGAHLDQPIGRDPRDRKRMSSRARNARAALTTIVAAEPLGGVSLVTLTIATGRTHQIRVHLSEAGHSVVGDALYHGVRQRVPPRLQAVARLDRPFLHAAEITIARPSDGTPLTVAAPMPVDLEDVLAALRRSASS